MTMLKSKGALTLVRGFLPILALSLVLGSELQAQNLGGCQKAFLELAQHSITLQQKRKLNDVQELRLGTYNTYNLIQSTDGHYQKSEKKRLGMALAIQESKLDVVVLQEVESRDSLELFNKHYLQDAYETFLTQGNDTRGIQIAYLIKKDLPFQFEIVSHSQTRAFDPVRQDFEPIFSRDLPNLRLWADSQDKNSEDPIVSFFGTHFKSKRNRAGDPESDILRRVQAETASTIIQSEIKTHPKSFVLMAGDFNGDIRYEDEFSSLKEIFKDAFDLNPNPLNSQQRSTHSFHPIGGETVYSQIDTFLVLDSQKELINNTHIYRYKNDNGETLELPRTWDERNENPSDHFPVILEINFRKHLQNRKLIEPVQETPLDPAA